MSGCSQHKLQFKKKEECEKAFPEQEAQQCHRCRCYFPSMKTKKGDRTQRRRKRGK